jgi:hypothetical protein
VSDHDWHLLWERVIVVGACVVLVLIATGTLK